MDPPREWVIARVAQPLIEIGGEIGLRVERLDLDTGVGEAPFVVGSGDGRDGAMLGGGGHGRRLPSLGARQAAIAPAQSSFEGNEAFAAY
jgi:hypothetical protein